MILKRRSQYSNTIVYQVINPSSRTVDIVEDQILGISYVGQPNTLPVEPKGKMSPRERARVVLKHLQINSHPELTHSQKIKVCKLILDFHDVFSVEEGDIGSIKNYEHSIKIENEQQLLKGNRTYPVPLKFLEEAKVELKRLENLGVIYKSKTRFSIPSFFIRKGTSGKLRLISDFRFLNSLISPELACIPSSQTLLTSFDESNAKFFCSLDLSDGFHSISLDDQAREYCSFTVPNVASYSYARLPLGLSNSPSSMSFVVQRALSDVKNCLFYVDDFLIFGKSVEEIIETLHIVLEKLKADGFRINYLD